MNQTSTIKLYVSTDDREKVASILSSVPLGDSVALVAKSGDAEQKGPDQVIEVEESVIHSNPDWFNRGLPFLFPPLPLSKENLLGLVFYHLGLADEALAISKGSDVHAILLFLFSQTDPQDWVVETTGSYARHNLAVLSFYWQAADANQVEDYFLEAIGWEDQAFLKAYSYKHYLMLLQELNRTEPAALKATVDGLELSDLVRQSLELERLRLHIQTMGPSELTETFKERLSGSVRFFDAHGDQFTKAELLLNMSWVASLEDSFSEALGYVNQAVEIYDQEGIEELLLDALLRKAAVLHQWAKTSAPQFYQQAIEVYQEGLKLCPKETAPYWFAEIHHQLGILYAEMPEENQKRAIWAAVSASSFKEALSYFTKSTHPVEYAAVCNNYGAALIHYPASVRSDNAEKAIGYLNESLSVRTADALPADRCFTLLNYLEACWEVSNVNETMERVRIKDMQEKAEELLTLATDDSMKAIALKHIEGIKALNKNVIVDA